MWGAGRRLRTMVLASVGTLVLVTFVLLALIAERAYDWRTRGEPRPLPRDLAAVATPPRLTGNPGQFFGPDDYPAEALRQGWEGKARVALLVDEDGTPTACEVIDTSGHDVLDRTTCRIAVGHVQFQPARDRRGRAVVGIYRTLNVRWQLPDG